MRTLSDVEPSFEELNLDDLSFPVLQQSATYLQTEGDGDTEWTIVAACRTPSGRMQFGIVPKNHVTPSVRDRALRGEYQGEMDDCA